MEKDTDPEKNKIRQPSVSFPSFDGTASFSRKKTITVRKSTTGEKVLLFEDDLEESEHPSLEKIRKKKKHWYSWNSESEAEKELEKRKDPLLSELRRDHLAKALRKEDFRIRFLELEDILTTDLSTAMLKSMYIASTYTINNYFGSPGPRNKGPRKLNAFLNQMILLESKAKTEAVSRAQKIAPPEFILHLTIIEAVDLISTDPDGLSDPFCKIWMNDSKESIKQTEIKTHTINPEWNETFIFNIQDTKNDILNIEIWDSDPKGLAANLELLKNVSSFKGFWIFCTDCCENVCSFGEESVDDFMGKITIPISDIYSEGINEWFMLQTERNEAITGQLHIAVKFGVLKPQDTIDALKRHLLLIRLCVEHGLKENEHSNLSVTRWDQVLCPAAFTLLFQHCVQGNISIPEDIICRFIVIVHLAQEYITFDYQFLYSLLFDSNECLNSPKSIFILENSLDNLYKKAVGIVYGICVTVINNLHAYDITESEDKRIQLEFVLKCLHLCHEISGDATFPWSVLKTEAINWFQEKSEAMLKLSPSDGSDYVSETLHFIKLFHSEADAIVQKVFHQKSYTLLTYEDLDSILNEPLKLHATSVGIESLNASGSDKLKKTRTAIDIFAKLKALIDYIQDTVGMLAMDMKMSAFRQWFGEDIVRNWFMVKQEYITQKIDSIISDDDLENRMILMAGRHDKLSSSPLQVADLIQREVCSLYDLVSHLLYPECDAFFLSVLHVNCLNYAESLMELCHSRNIMKDYKRSGKKKLCVMANNLWALAIFIGDSFEKTIGIQPPGSYDTKLCLQVLCLVLCSDMSSEDTQDVICLIKRVTYANQRRRQEEEIHEYTKFINHLMNIEATSNMAFEIYLLYQRQMWLCVIRVIEYYKELKKTDNRTCCRRCRKCLSRAPNVFEGLLTVLKETEKLCYIDPGGKLKEYVFTEQYSALKMDLEHLASKR